MTGAVGQSGMRTLILSIVLLSAQTALAMHPMDRTERARWCRQHPEDCTDVNEERRAQLREWCENNPVDCDEERQAALERRHRLARNHRAKQNVRDTVVEQGRRVPDRTGPPR